MAAKLQSNRFELKYLVSESTAQQIVQFVHGYLVADEAAGPGESYPVNSLYLDSGGLTLYRQTIHALKNRFKLRIRFYDDEPESPVFLEIKRRVSDIILKERAAITREGCHELLRGSHSNPAWLLSNRTKDLRALENFFLLKSELQADGTVYVSYMREAYVSPEGNHMRVTFDRQIVGGRYENNAFIRCPKNMYDADVRGVVLELKFNESFPRWMSDLIYAFDLQRCSVPKYIACGNAIGFADLGQAALRVWGETQ